MFRKLSGAALAATCAVVLASCSTRMKYEPIPQTGATLTGTVTYKKEKVGIGMVIVQGAADGVTTDIGPDGKYTALNVPVGEVRIAVNMAAARGKQIGEAMSRSPDGKKTQSAPVQIPNIPQKYTDVNTTPVKTTTNPGENKFDIVID